MLYYFDSHLTYMSFFVRCKGISSFFDGLDYQGFGFADFSADFRHPWALFCAVLGVEQEEISAEYCAYALE